MQAPAWQVHTLGVGRLVQASQHGSQSRCMGSLNSGLAPFLKKVFQPLMPEGLNHGLLYRVTHHMSSCRIRPQWYHVRTRLQPIKIIRPVLHHACHKQAINDESTTDCYSAIATIWLLGG